MVMLYFIKGIYQKKAWWGDYSADALQYLNIHGGITYRRKEAITLYLVLIVHTLGMI